ncbi:uncharacterized protein LOC121517817 [Cheilinus undulatus]|uniref:uncharacterized protein LOC121517817 n=1 Tax=Cheilinus undulatus TaxID=241271 RepID=UPI001BD1D90F|nr:uncharacterized protein LOC121517817 [Cheilinus undulatus]
MYPTTKGPEAAPSFSGINFQARPVVGAAQQNIMNLVPVQLIMQKLVPPQMSQTNPTLNTAATANILPIVLTQIPILSTPSPSVRQPSRTHLRNICLNKVNLDHNSPDKHLPKEQPLHVNKVPVISVPAETCQKSGTCPGHFPVAAVSLANMNKERGLIPVKKQTQTVPASQLLPRTITPLSYSAPGFNVVHNPPFKLRNQALAQTNSPVPPSTQILPNAASKTVCATPSAGSEPNLEPTSHTPQRPNSPNRRRVEDKDSSAPPTPLSSTITSEIPRTLAQKERACKQPDVINATVPTLGKGRQGEEGALVLCNGKVFKKSSLMFHIVKSNSASQFHTTKVPAVQNSDSVTPQTKPVYKCVIPRHSHKVISLCENDSPGNKPQRAASQLTSPDGDNVLFMPYIPPKSESGTSEDLTSKTQRAPVKEAEQTGTGGDTGDGRKLHNNIINLGINPSRVSEAAGVNVNDNEEPNVRTQQSPAIQQVKCVDAALKQQEPEDTSISDSSSSQSTADMDSLKEKSSVDLTLSSCLDPKSCQRSDGLLRQKFGVSAGVRISLQRIDPWCRPAELHHGGFHQETTFRVGEELPSADPYSRSVSVSSEEEQDPYGESVSVKSEEEPSGDTSPHTCDKALKCSLEDYTEPIEDEEILEKQTAHKQVIPTDESKLRIRRTMKRTVCPCCIPGTQIKALTMGQMRRKGERARKRRRSPGKTSGQTAKNESSDTPDSDRFCQTWSEDFDDLRSYEEITRLKKLLKEREAALELIRKATVETEN